MSLQRPLIGEKPATMRFKHLLAFDVIPTIKKTGRYDASQTTHAPPTS
jgi:hypothetical protein